VIGKRYYSYDTEIAPYAHKLKVSRYEPLGQYFECEVVEPEGYGRKVRIDPFIGGELSDEWNDENIIGKTIEVDYVHGFVFLAEGVRVVG